MILAEPGWELVGIYADKGLSGTQTKHRTEFNRLIRHCKSGKIDMVITKSISRLARNNLDMLTYTRKLREIGVDIYFEEQNIHSIDPTADFMISIHGSIAQSESENISQNVRWGKIQSAKEGKVPFTYKNFLGYRKGADGNPEIDPEEAKIIHLIYSEFLAGKTYRDICKILEDRGVSTPTGKNKWGHATVESILKNEKYKGDYVTNKTFVADVLSKKVKKNDGVIPQYYISNNHPAIIDTVTFDKVQDEISRRENLKRRYDKRRKTSLAKYTGKYPFSDIVFCGECGSGYKRCTWTSHGKKRVVWRCIKRYEYGTRYCHHSPTIYEDDLKCVVLKFFSRLIDEHAIDVVKSHLNTQIKLNSSAERISELRKQIEDMQAQADRLLNMVTADGTYNIEEDESFGDLLKRKYEDEKELSELLEKIQNEEYAPRSDEAFDYLQLLQNQPIEFYDDLIRKNIKHIIIVDKSTVNIELKSGYSASEMM